MMPPQQQSLQCAANKVTQLLYLVSVAAWFGAAVQARKPEIGELHAPCTAAQILGASPMLTHWSCCGALLVRVQAAAVEISASVNSPLA